MKTLSTEIKLTFIQEIPDGPIETKVDMDISNIPKTVIIECIQKIAQGLCMEVIRDADQYITMEGIGGYINACRAVDQEKLNLKFKSLPE